jgi:hypothetical protein
MRRSLSILRISAALLLFLWLPADSSEISAKESASRSIHVLLIGIGAYPQDSGVSPLDGPTNDVKLLRDVLVDRFRIPAANITVLVEPKAPTHTAIERAFADLAKRVRRNDIVYIHFSGHGSTSPDPAESSGQDQTWISFGARSPRHAGKDHLDVLDKEIALWMKPIYELSDDVVFVSDSCHSASIARGERIGVRFTPPINQQHPLLASLPRLAPPETGLRIGAARDGESAVELDPTTGLRCEDPNNCFGVFTWYWAKALREANAGESWADVFNRTNTFVSTVNAVTQRPQIEGRSDRAVFGGRFANVSPAVGVIRVSADGKSVLINAGALSGVTVGSTYRHFSSGGGRPLEPVLKITSVAPLVSEASTINGKVALGDLVTEFIHVYSIPPIRLHVTGDEATGIDAALVRQLQTELSKATASELSAFEVVDQPSKADWWVYVARTNAVTTKGVAMTLPPSKPCSTHPCNSPELWVISKQGVLLHERMRISLDGGKAAIARLISNLRTFSWSQEVRRLAGQGNSLPVELALTIHRSPAIGAGSCRNIVGEAWRRDGPYGLGAIEKPPSFNDCLSFTLKNDDPERSWYAYVVAIGPDFAVHALFPGKGSVDDVARLKPKESKTSLALPSKYYQLDEPGREMVLLLVSEGPVQTQTLEQSGVKGPDSISESHVSRLLSAGARRQGQVEASRVDAWGAESAEFVISKP